MKSLKSCIFLLLFPPMTFAMGMDDIPKCTGAAMPVETLLRKFPNGQERIKIATTTTYAFREQCSRVSGICREPVPTNWAGLAIYEYIPGNIGRFKWGDLKNQNDLYAIRNGNEVVFEFSWADQKENNRVSTPANMYDGSGAFYMAGYPDDKSFQLGVWEIHKRTNYPFGGSMGRLDETGCFYVVKKISVETSSTSKENYYVVQSGTLD